MTTPDQARIAADRARPRLLELWWALQPLKSVIRFMQSGAHPDDEMSGMLAALAFRDGFTLSYACSTRGEGGQNDIGTEAGADLGALRTQEMERACDVLGMRMYWHSHGPDDPITDFGFSKSGEETLDRWGHARTLARFVEIVRRERPDILCPTFLDVPGQHGHHRAMTQAAHEVMAAAADPAFASNLPPWQIAKLYLPAMSGAGQAYDDAEPPPPATLTVDGSGGDPASGWAWNRIGQQSRSFHRTQGMGRWVPPGPGCDWPLHLVENHGSQSHGSQSHGAQSHGAQSHGAQSHGAESHGAAPDTALASGLVTRVGEMAALPGAAPIAGALTEAQAGIDAALAAFPDFGAVAQAALRALRAVRAAQAACPRDLADAALHRLKDKEIQLGRVLRHALGVEARCRTADAFVLPGQSTRLTVELDHGAAESATIDFDLPQGWRAEGDVLRIATDAAPSDPYRADYDPRAAQAPAMCLTIRVAGDTVTLRLPFEAPPVVLPPVIATPAPEGAVINLATQGRAVDVTVSGVVPEGATVEFAAPEGWNIAATAEGATLSVPPDAAPGIADIAISVAGQAASTVRRIAHDHVAPTAVARPAQVRVAVLDARVPEGRVGYIGAGNDRVDHWLLAMGADVTALSDDDLASDIALGAYSALVIGIFALRFRPALLAAMPRLHRWTKAGGTLVTLYHRPWDNWDPRTVPPRRLEIGQPSLRWRVTDERATVRHLGSHPLLSTPNAIGPADWDGWVKERGLYFAKSWDDAYRPLIELADPGEAPHRGALLAADIGTGRHVHTSLILHHQMEHLVPGAFRLMANLIAPR